MNPRDSHKYSRQVSVVGSNIGQVRVLLVGLDGCGCEVAKNLVLMGVHTVTLWDPDGHLPPLRSDADYNFIVAAATSTFAETLTTPAMDLHASYLKTMNTDVVVVANTDDEPPIDKFSGSLAVCVICSTRFGAKRIHTWSSKCRSLGLPCVFAWQGGVSGVVATDFGPQWRVAETLAHRPAVLVVTSLTVLPCNTTTFQVLATLREVEGAQHAAISTGAVTFIADVSDQHETCLTPLEQSLITALSKEKYLLVEGSGSLIEVLIFNKHEAFNVCLAMCANTTRAVIAEIPSVVVKEVAPPTLVSHEPLFDQLAQPQTLLAGEAQRDLYSALFGIQDKIAIDGRCLLQLSAAMQPDVWRVRLQPLCASIGGVAAQEALKCTGKYMPLSSPLYLKAEGLLQANAFNTIATAIPMDRNDHLRCIVGNENLERIRNASVFVVGCGAVGCEHLKNLVLLGVGTVCATDSDKIDLSNVTRQFLFREDGDIGKSKSLVACERAAQFDRSVTVRSYENFVTEDDTSLFSASFWETQTIVMGAVDSLGARFVIDAKCTQFAKPFVECGTEGMTCAFHPTVPGKTQSYRRKRVPGNRLLTPRELHWAIAQDAKARAIPVCTQKMFPHSSAHCISWALEKFDEVFGASSESALMLQRLACCPSIDAAKLASHEMAQNLLLLWFDSNIRELLRQYPPNNKNDNEGAFWKGEKRLPRPLKASAVAGLASQGRSPATMVALFISSFSAISNRVAARFVGGPQGDSNAACEPHTGLRREKFEKDVDSNDHVNFVMSAANLRAWNYRLQPSSFTDVKLLAGRIVPAIASTTSAVSGMACIEALKVLVGSTEHLRTGDWALHTANPSRFAIFVPDPPPETLTLPSLRDGSRIVVPFYGLDTQPTIVVKVADSMTLGDFSDAVLSAISQISCNLNMLSNNCCGTYNRRVQRFLSREICDSVLSAFPTPEGIVEAADVGADIVAGVASFCNICEKDALLVITIAVTDQLLRESSTSPRRTSLAVRLLRHCPEVFVPYMRHVLDREPFSLDDIESWAAAAHNADTEHEKDVRLGEIRETQIGVEENQVWQLLDSHVDGCHVVKTRLESGEVGEVAPASLPRLDRVVLPRLPPLQDVLLFSRAFHSIDLPARAHFQNMVGDRVTFDAQCELTEKIQHCDMDGHHCLRNVVVPLIRVQIAKLLEHPLARSSDTFSNQS